MFAEYRSTSPDNYFDIENILLYNIGLSCFRKIDIHSLHIKRTAGLIPKAPNCKVYSHYYAYQLAEVCKKGHNIGQTIQKWHSVTIPKPTAQTKPATYWVAMKNASSDFVRYNIQYKPMKPLGLSIYIHGPEKIQLTTSIKPMIDGIVSSMHAHDGSNLDKIVPRLSKQLSIEPEKIKELLLEEENTVLGKKKLLSLRDKSIQWHPDDNLMTEITVGHEEGKQWHISGSLYFT